MIRLQALHYGNCFESMLNKWPTKEFESDNDYTWDVVGSSRKNVPLVEARALDGTVVTPSTTGMIGAGMEPFFLVFDENYFFDDDYIVGEKNEAYVIRVLGDARQEGTNNVYKCEMAGGNTLGIPAEELIPGKRFSYETNYVENNLSRKAGGLNYSTPISMRNEWSTIRMYEKVGGRELSRGELAFGIPVVDNMGKETVKNMWIHVVEWEFERKFSEAKNNAMLFGRSNRNSNGEYTTIGKSGQAVKTGAGYFEQIEVNNTMFYNTTNPLLVMKLINNAIYQLSSARIEMSKRYFLIQTGEMGARLLNEAIKRDVSGWIPFGVNITGDNLGIIQKTSSELHKNALNAAGFQFTEWAAANGVRVRIEVNPMYDDPVRNKIDHPAGGKAMSYRFDITYMGSEEQPNVQKCKIKGVNEYRGYRFGLRNPFTGETSNRSMGYDEDSAEMHRMTQLGIFVLDPTKVISLIPDLLRA